MIDKGLRYNEGKIRYDLLPPFSIEQLAKVLGKGAEKYVDRNWELGMRWSKVIASLKRHLAAVERGEDYDHETGLLHAAHILTNAAFLTEYYKIYPQGDDRPHKYLRPIKIGLDVDEVLAAYCQGWANYWGTNPKPTAWCFDRNIKARFKEMEEKKLLDEFYSNLEPLVKPEDIPFEPYCYITSRPTPTSVTEEWLDKHGFPTSPVYSLGLGVSKVETAKEVGIDVYVDDSYRNFVELNNAGICCFLWDRPHNQRYDVGYKRINSFKALV